jgi:gliding motility-associated-like protein
MSHRLLTRFLLFFCVLMLGFSQIQAQTQRATIPAALPTDIGMCSHQIVLADTSTVTFSTALVAPPVPPAVAPASPAITREYTKTTFLPAVGTIVAKGTTFTMTIEVWQVVGVIHTKTSTDTKNINIIDTEKPVAPATLPAITVECDAIIPQPTIGTDNCGITWSYNSDGAHTPVAPICPNNYDFVRTWKASDAAGNIAVNTTVQTIQIRDTKKPVIATQPTDVAISVCTSDANIDIAFTNWISMSVHGFATATDCSALTWTPSVATLPAANCAAPTTVGVYRNITGVFFTVKDACNNMAVTTNPAFFQVSDNTPPVITSCPSGVAGVVTQNTDPAKCTSSLFAPIFTETCGTSGKINCIIDAAAPIIVTAPITNGMGGSGIFIADVAIGTHTIEFIVEDCAGNKSASCKYNLTVVDNSLPTITCPANIMQLNDATKCTAVVTLPFPTNITDNCGFTIVAPATTPTVTYKATGATIIPVTMLSAATTQVFNLGTTAVTYEVIDKNGNKNTCSFTVLVEDKTAPIAKCKPQLIFYTNPAGITPDILTVAMVDDGSTDNSCVPTLTISQTTFNCAPPSPNPIVTPVTLTVKDMAGNTSTCVTSVRTENIPPVPTYQLGVCGNDRLQLFANAPAGTFTYKWDGPNGFVSFDKNPIKTNLTALNTGTYKVEITGFGGCKSIGAVEVTIPNSIVTPRLRGLPNYCEGTTIDLRTDVTNADTYIWTSPNFSQLTTTTNVLTIPATIINAGYWTVTTIKNNCSSYESEPFQVHVEAKPVVVVSNNSPVCIGNDIQLSVRTTPGASYQWTGPASFSSLEQNPKIVGATASGTYNVTVTSVGGCVNMGATNTVVNSRPSITSISTDAPTCVSGTENVKLQATLFPINAGGYQYRWVGTNGFTSTDSEPVLPNVTAANNGTYTLTVQNAFGCESQPRSVVVGMKNIPTTPVLASNYGPYCAGDNYTLTTTNLTGTQVEYTWTTPLGTFLTQNPSITVANATFNSTGNYTVRAKVDGCTSKPSAVIPIQVNNKPAIPIIVANNAMVCEGSAIELSTTQIIGARYAWTGPAGFTASVFNPIILPARAENAGAYTVQVTVKNCVSDVSIPQNIVVNAVPHAPSVKNNGPVCGDNAATPLTLGIVLSSAIPGASYSWYYSKTNTRIAPATSSLNLTVPMSDLVNYTDGNHDFYAVTTLNGCTSANSVPTTVTINRIPTELAYAGASQRICDGTPVLLAAKKPTIGTGAWSIASTVPTILLPNVANTEIKNLRTGQTYWFYWTLSNGECKNYARDSVSIIIDTNTERANAGRDTSVCGVTSLNLYAQLPILGGVGSWSQSAVQDALGVRIQSLNTPTSLVTGMVPGNTYAFKWTLTNRGCSDFASDEVIVKVASRNDRANAGQDFTVCSPDATLNAAVPQAATGNWTSNDATISLASSPLANTRVSNLKLGKNRFIWTLQNAGCGMFSTDTLYVTYENTVVARPDVYEINFTGRIDLDVVANDIKPAGFTISTKSNPQQGILMDKGRGIYTYDPSASFSGTDSFEYLLCSPTCPTSCATGTVNFKVGANATCQVPTIITPNNDGMNDSFIVPCLYTPGYPDNEVSIFNQWGDEVFNGKPYKNDWNGTYNGEDLPAGTYYYVVKFVLGREAKTGFIMIQR